MLKDKKTDTVVCESEEEAFLERSRVAEENVLENLKASQKRLPITIKLQERYINCIKKMLKECK